MSNDKRLPFVRPNEAIGAGFFVFKRGTRTGRIGISSHFPFEHPTRAAAEAEAQRLAGKFPGKTYEVFASTGFVARSADAPVLTVI